MIGWLMLGSWIAIVWMMWKVVQNAKVVARDRRPLLRARTALTHRNRHRRRS